MLAFRLELYPVYPPACTSFAHLGFTDLADQSSCGGLFIAGARFSNYVAWLDRPAVYRPGARCRHFGPVLDSDLRRCLDRWTYLPLCVCVWAIAVFPTMLLVTYLKVVFSEFGPVLLAYVLADWCLRLKGSGSVLARHGRMEACLLCSL